MIRSCNKSIVFLLSIFLISAPTYTASAAEPGANDTQKIQALINECEASGLGQTVNGMSVCNRMTKPLSPLVKEIISTHADLIVEYGEKLKVDPRAIAGAILAENSMNVSVDDTAQNWLASFGITKVTVGGYSKEFTYGLGQVGSTVVYQAEDKLAKIENRTRLSSDESRRQALTPEGSIKYVAAYMKIVSDAYKEAGFNIDNQPEILATVYNLGQPEERAQRAKINNRQPKPNYFGMYINHHMKEIEASISWSPSSDTNNQIQITQTQKEKFESLKQTRAVNTADKNTMLNLRDEIELSAMPDTCINSTTPKQYPTGTKAKGEYDIVLRVDGCNMSTWLLIEMADGTSGWAEKSKVLAASSALRVPRKTCNMDRNKTSECLRNAGLNNYYFDGADSFVNNDSGKIYDKALICDKKLIDTNVLYNNSIEIYNIDSEIKKAPLATDLYTQLENLKIACSPDDKLDAVNEVFEKAKWAAMSYGLLNGNIALLENTQYQVALIQCKVINIALQKDNKFDENTAANICSECTYETTKGQASNLKELIKIKLSPEYLNMRLLHIIDETLSNGAIYGSRRLPLGGGNCSINYFADRSDAFEKLLNSKCDGTVFTSNAYYIDKYSAKYPNLKYSKGASEGRDQWKFMPARDSKNCKIAEVPAAAPSDSTK
jgi:predicted lipoprotein with Yx(FWY)xxD motif